MGDSSDDNELTKEEYLNAIKAAKSEKRKKKFYVNMINVEEVNAIAHLPFIHLSIGEGLLAKMVKAMVDSGSSATLINKSLLDSLNLNYKRKPFKERISSFSGNNVATDNKAELSINLGSGQISYDFIVCTGTTPYDVVLGIDFQREMNLSLINATDGSYFLHNVQRIDCKSLNDPVDSVSSVDAALKEELVDELVELTAATGITLKGSDVYFLLVEARNVDSGFYHFLPNDEMSKNRIKVLQDVLLLTPTSTRSSVLQTLLQIIVDRPSSAMVSISPQTSIGGIKAVETDPNRRLEVEVVNHISLVDKVEPEKLYIYPARINPSPERIKEIASAQKVRKE